MPPSVGATLAERGNHTNLENRARSAGKIKGNFRNCGPESCVNDAPALETIDAPAPICCTPLQPMQHPASSAALLSNDALHCFRSRL